MRWTKCQWANKKLWYIKHLHLWVVWSTSSTKVESMEQKVHSHSLVANIANNCIWKLAKNNFQLFLCIFNPNIFSTYSNVKYNNLISWIIILYLIVIFLKGIRVLIIHTFVIHNAGKCKCFKISIRCFYKTYFHNSESV